MPFPAPIRPTSGHSIRKPQTAERTSNGAQVIYSKSSLTLHQHQYATVFDYAGFINMQAFFFSFAHGARNPFAWVDHAEVSRAVRLSGSRISVRQAAYNRYETQFSLLEEL